MGNGYVFYDERDRYGRQPESGSDAGESEFEREHRRRQQAWSPTDRSSYRPRGIYQAEHEPHDFYGRRPRSREGSGYEDERGYDRERYEGRWREGAGDYGYGHSGSQGSDRYADQYGYGRTGLSGNRGKGPRGYKRSDARIQEDICERLYEDDYIDASDIEIQVQDGVATLTGEVSDRRSKRRAEDIAEYCSGVVDVQNNLRVKRSGGTEQPTAAGKASGG